MFTLFFYFCRLLATDMLQTRSAHTLCKVSNLTNVADFSYKNRENLLKERFRYYLTQYGEVD